jgi:hypothetical protein
MLGRGIVAAVDEMDSRHPPSHPELLAWLARDFEAGNYDIKRLVRTIALSRTYQLDSRYKGATPPPPELFARGLEKPLMAEVLWRSALIAAGGDAGHDKSPDAVALRERFIAEFPDLFASEYSFSLQQAMFLTNNPLLDALLKPNADNTAARLSGLPDSRSRVREAFEIVLGRPPAPDELEHAATYLDARSERPDAAIGQLLWTLMADPEFLLNH